MTELRTEDTGKIFEMAICLALETPYDGPFQYSHEEAQKLVPRLRTLRSLLGDVRYIHTAKKGARYDFTAETDTTLHLSAKTNKTGCRGGSKVAPQVVGQAQPSKFCEVMGIPCTDVTALKEYIQCHISEILPILIDHTFDCPNLYYNQKENLIRFIRLIPPISWNADFTWTKLWPVWNNSSTLKIKHADGTEIPLLEIQFHTKSRTNMAVRWCYENLLTLFPANFQITAL
jgi:hypothetical protein